MPVSRQYPHVDDITDWRAQQSIRLLWDRVCAIEAGLQGVEATVGDLASDSAARDTALTEASQAAQDALAQAQVVAAKVEGLEQGEATIPDYGDIVASVLATKFASPIVPAAQEEAGKAQLTRAAAWEIYSTRDPNMRLLAKTYGNQINNRSVDIILQATDGSYADCASAKSNGDGTVTILATWGAAPGDANTTDTARWIVPTAAIAAESGPMTPV